MGLNFLTPIKKHVLDTCDDCGDVLDEELTHLCEETLMNDNTVNEVEQDEDEYVLHYVGERTIKLNAQGPAE